MGLMSGRGDSGSEDGNGFGDSSPMDSDEDSASRLSGGGGSVSEECWINETFPSDSEQDSGEGAIVAGGLRRGRYHKWAYGSEASSGEEQRQDDWCRDLGRTLGSRQSRVQVLDNMPRMHQDNDRTQRLAAALSEHGLAHNARIREVDMAYILNGETGVRCARTILRGLGSNPASNIGEVNLEGCVLGGLGQEAGELLGGVVKACAHLTQLHLKGNALPSVGPIFRAVAQHTALRKLNLKGSVCCSEDLQAACQMVETNSSLLGLMICVGSKTSWEVDRESGDLIPDGRNVRHDGGDDGKACATFMETVAKKNRSIHTLKIFARGQLCNDKSVGGAFASLLSNPSLTSLVAPMGVGQEKAAMQEAQRALACNTTLLKLDARGEGVLALVEGLEGNRALRTLKCYVDPNPIMKDRTRLTENSGCDIVHLPFTNGWTRHKLEALRECAGNALFGAPRLHYPWLHLGMERYVDQREYQIADWR